MQDGLSVVRPGGSSVTGEPTSAELFRRMEELNEIGISLSRVKDTNRLLEAILVAAKKITNADGGTLYRVDADKKLVHFEIVWTDSLDIAMGGTTGVEVPFYPVRLFDDDGQPNNSMVVAYSVLQDETVNITDAYVAKGFDFTGTKNFDAKTGYRSKSFLTVPMKNHEDEIRRPAIDQCQGPPYRGNSFIFGSRSTTRRIAGVPSRCGANESAAHKSAGRTVRVVH